MHRYLSCYPTNRFVHSSFGFYGRVRGGALPGTWFVRAFAALGMTESAVRQTLHRMVKSEELNSSREGRDTLYRPTEFSWAALDAGAERLAGPPRARAWDGQWTLVHCQFAAEQRLARERIGVILETEGFARMANGLFIHPRDRAERVLHAAREEGYRANLTVFRGQLISDESERKIAATHWDLRALRRDYKKFLGRYGSVDVSSCDPREAFTVRLALTLDYLDVAWRDPDLPAELLDETFPANAAAQLVSDLNGRLLPLARQFGDEVLDAVLEANPRLAERLAADTDSSPS